jgi:hypothetical protein
MAAAAAEHFEGRKARHEDRRLTDGGGIESVGRTAATDGEQVVAEDRRGAGEESCCLRAGFHPIASHADRLRTLPGKDDRGRGSLAGVGRVAHAAHLAGQASSPVLMTVLPM